jgi:hypothetical protein
MNKQELIEFIRGNQIIGKGSCSVIDECWEDERVWEHCKDARDIGEAFDWIMSIHEIYEDRIAAGRQGVGW